MPIYCAKCNWTDKIIYLTSLSGSKAEVVSRFTPGDAWLPCSHQGKPSGGFLCCSSALFPTLLLPSLFFIQTVSEEYSFHHLFYQPWSLYASHTSLRATCYPSIVNTPTHAPTHTRICMHAYTRASEAEKGRPNASFDVMALRSLSWFPLLLRSSIIHNLHIVCCCVREMWLCQKQNLAHCERLVAKRESGRNRETAMWSV